MKKIIPLIAIALSFSCSSTQTTVEQNNSNPTKYLSSITVKDLKKHLFIVTAIDLFALFFNKITTI